MKGIKKTTKHVSLTILETIYPLTSTRYLRWFDVWHCVFFALPLVFVIFFLSHFISSVFFQHRKTNKRAKAIIIYNLLFLRTVWVCSFEMKQQQWSSSSLSWWRWMEEKNLPLIYKLFMKLREEEMEAQQYYHQFRMHFNEDKR